MEHFLQIVGEVGRASSSRNVLELEASLKLAGQLSLGSFASSRPKRDCDKQICGQGTGRPLASSHATPKPREDSCTKVRKRPSEAAGK